MNSRRIDDMSSMVFLCGLEEVAMVEDDIEASSAISISTNGGLVGDGTWHLLLLDVEYVFLELYDFDDLRDELECDEFR